jgi:hypothetical protein
MFKVIITGSISNDSRSTGAEKRGKITPKGRILLKCVCLHDCSREGRKVMTVLVGHWVGSVVNTKVHFPIRKKLGIL